MTTPRPGGRGPRRFRRRSLPPLSLAVTGGLVALSFASVVARPPADAKSGGKRPPAAATGIHDPGEGSCDVDGVTVTYDVSFHGTAPAGFLVDQATVGDISDTCEDALLSLELRNGETVLGAFSTPVDGTSVGRAPDPLARAEDVTSVHVELAGGALPVPDACDGMAFDNVLIGTGGDDTLTTTQRRNIIFGLGGDDTLRGSQQDDCVVGQDGADRLFGDQGKDVLVGGPGDDHLDGGNGKDVCYGGPGADVFVNCEIRHQD